MRIAQIAPPWIAIPPKNYGGTENVIYHLVEEQVAEGHEVTLFASGDTKTSAQLVSFLPHALLEEGVPWQAHRKAYYHLHKAVEYVRAQGTFDIVHTHLSSITDMYLFPLMASFAIPHVTTLHSNLPFDKKPGKTVEADEYYMEWAQLVPIVAISESARAQQPWQLNFIDVVHHGLPLDTYRPTSKPREEYFMWLGRFSPEKGAHLAIEAARLAQVPLVLAGTVDRSSKEATRYFHEVIKPSCDDPLVRYMGPVDMRKKIRLLDRARGFLNPIEWEEPFGMVMIEAMAVGCPVISFARGAAPEIVVHGETGFLVEDVTEMVSYIPHIGEINPAAPRAHVERNFSAPVMARKYIEVYQKAITQRQEAQPALP